MKFTPSILALVALGVSAFAQEQTLFNGKDLTGWEGNTANEWDSLYTGTRLGGREGNKVVVYEREMIDDDCKKYFEEHSVVRT